MAVRLRERATDLNHGVYHGVEMDVDGDLRRRLERCLPTLDAIADPRLRYRQACAAEDLLLEMAERMADVRAAVAHELHRDGASYAEIARAVGVSRGRAQQLVNRGRAVRMRSRELVERGHALVQESWGRAGEVQRRRARNRRRWQKRGGIDAPPAGDAAAAGGGAGSVA